MIQDMIIDSNDASFVADVINESRTRPVIVDFWAGWCGPCKQLTPLLEKVVKEAKGAVRLVKIDVDKNPGIAGQLRVQSLPTVYAFVEGRPVDAFMGLKPESELSAFVKSLIKDDGQTDIDAVLTMATTAFETGDMNGAMQAYAMVLEAEPENLKALAGLAKLYLKVGQTDHAKQVLESVPLDAKSAEIDAMRAALELLQQDPQDTDALIKAIADNPQNHQARFDLASALAGIGDMSGAIDQLLIIIKSEPNWQEDAARHYLFKIFQALGHQNELTKQGRRKLASMVFS